MKENQSQKVLNDKNNTIQEKQGSSFLVSDFVLPYKIVVFIDLNP